MHNGQIIMLGFPLTFDAIEYLMEKFKFKLFKWSKESFERLDVFKSNKIEIFKTAFLNMLTINFVKSGIV